jgi:F-box and WD-40 domain protein CDC4
MQIVEPVLDEATGKYQPPYPIFVTGSRDHTLRVWKLPRKGEAAHIGGVKMSRKVSCVQGLDPCLNDLH